MDREKDYSVAMAHLEAGCATKGISSIKFKDGEMVMMSLDLMRQLISDAEQKNQGRVMIFIANGPDIKENLA